MSVPCTICACMPWDPNTQAMRSARRGPVGSRFASPHAVRRSLTDPLQSPVHFGDVFRCACPDYHRLTPHIIKRRPIPCPQVGRSHNPLVAGSSPARPTYKYQLLRSSSKHYVNDVGNRLDASPVSLKLAGERNPADGLCPGLEDSREGSTVRFSRGPPTASTTG